ncbi:hypothetical protein BRADI_1g42876v3 [Brachypodium distachyon]|uniref:Uncharacterized protein n=1 Tax=Brachypodium distachyon TaxID=15368 RepID=A0A0Q3L5L4_BRADI|nr:hypothetical protein BRADI_1g42876v3 [Brachypodium distachyon]
MRNTTVHIKGKYRLYCIFQTALYCLPTSHRGIFSFFHSHASAKTPSEQLGHAVSANTNKTECLSNALP